MRNLQSGQRRQSWAAGIIGSIAVVFGGGGLALYASFVYGFTCYRCGDPFALMVLSVISALFFGIVVLLARSWFMTTVAFVVMGGFFTWLWVWFTALWDPSIYM